MKSMLKVLPLLLLIVALAGGTYLVKKSQDSRKSADVGLSSMSIQPSQVTSSAIGSTFAIKLFVDSGATTDKIQGIEAYLNFDRAKLQLLTAAEGGAVDGLIPGYNLLNNGKADGSGTVMPWIDDGSGPLTVKMLNMGLDPNQPLVNSGYFLTLRFKVKENAGSAISIVDESASVQTSINISNVGTWVIPTTKRSSSSVNGGGVTTTVTKTPPTITLGACVGEGQKATSGQNCCTGLVKAECSQTTSGSYCVCRKPSGIGECRWCGSQCTKFAGDCPAVMPPAGQRCVTTSEGACQIVDGEITPPVGDKVVKLNVGGPGQVTITSPSGTEFEVSVGISAGLYKISAIDVQLDFNDLGAVAMTEVDGSKVPKIEVNSYFDNKEVVSVNPTTRRIKLKLSATKAEGQLLSGIIPVAKIKVMAMKEGAFLMRLDPVYVNNMAGPVGGVATQYSVLRGGVASVTFADKLCPQVTPPADIRCKQMGTGPDGCQTMVNKPDGTSCGEGLSCKSGVCGTNTSFVTCNGVDGKLPAGIIAHNLGNANCDGAVNSLDFETWRGEAIDQNGMSTDKVGWKADFDQNKRSDMGDYGIFVKTIKE